MERAKLNEPTRKLAEWLTMGINLVIAVTDDDWFEMLRRHPNLDEVNFWAPSAA